MDLIDASDRFRRAIKNADNLVQVHRLAGTGGRGRRYAETSVNRAVVVVTVATWQALVQDLTLAALDTSAPAPGSPGVGYFNVISGRIRKEVGDLNTPSSQNVRQLLVGVGFDPRPHWTWSQPGGRGGQRTTLTPIDIDDRVNWWLKVRHAVAHGHEHLPPVPVLQHVRQSAVAPMDPALRLVDATQCMSFFRKLVEVTGDALAIHLGVAAPSWR